MSISKTAFDGAAAWANLQPDEQAMFGATLMEMLAAGWLTFDADESHDAVLLRAVRHAEDKAKESLVELFQETEVWQGVRDPDGAWRIPSLIGQVCYGCGCSHEDPCEDGCGWAAENLCTACEEAAAPAPKIAKAEAAAVRKVVCTALHESPVADPRTLPPMGAELRDLARRIGHMNDEGVAGG